MSFSLTLGVLSALTLTIIMVVWEWIENPGGIYHNHNGTNWSFIYDLGVSWFVPTFIYATVISSLLYFVSSLIKRRKGDSS